MYPVTREASSVRDVLLARAKKAGVILTCAEIVDIQTTSQGFEVA